MKPILQEASMGCAIACCASLTNLTYKQMRAHFDNGDVKEKNSGFYNRDIINALNRVGVRARGYNVNRWGNKKIKIGAIVFIECSEKYPEGHYLLKTENGWMNPWINYPYINPAKAGFQKRLPGKAKWIIEIIK